MHSPEFGTRQEKEQFVGYAHNFVRHVTVNGQQIDHLAQALQHMSYLYGEVYVFGRIDPSNVRQILLPTPTQED